MDFIDVLTWVGILTFAATGALVGVEKRFDLIGVTILAVVTALGGGGVRDVIVGYLPPAAFRSEAYIWGATLTGVLTFYLHRYLSLGRRPLYLLDSLGLALFAALGAERGLSFGLGPAGTIFAGAISGVGGGILRDLLSGQVPGIFYRSGDFYASAAALGALTVFLLYGLHPELALVAGVVTTLTMRLGSRLLGLELPVPREEP